MVQLIKKGGLRERANRSRRYEQSENQQTTLKPNVYQKSEQENTQHISKITQTTSSSENLVQHQSIVNQPNCEQ